MTTYRTNGALCHAWAYAADGENGKTPNGNLSFRGGRLFSYNTCIGQNLLLSDGNHWTFLTDYSFSATTSSKHYPARNAAVANANVLWLPDVFADFNNQQLVPDTTTVFKAYLPKALDEVAHFLGKAERARVHSSVFYNLNRARRFRTALYHLVLHFDLMEHYAALLIEKNCEPARFGALEEKVDVLEDQADEINAAKQAKAREQLDRWVVDTTVPAGQFYSLPVRLRTKGDVVETSHHAEIPLRQAIKLWPVLQAHHELGRPYRPTTLIRLGHYTLDRFEDDVLIVGCHRIAFAEIERIAVLLELPNAGEVKEVA